MKVSKKKQIQIISYFLVVIVGSFFLTAYIEAARISDFLLSQQETIQEDKRKLILASAIANTFGEVEVFVQKDSLLSITLITNEIEMVVDFYALGYVKEDQIDYALAVLITDYKIPSVQSSNDQLQEIVLTIQFNQAITIRENSQAKTEFEEGFISLYTEADQLAIFEVSTLLSQYPSLAIDSMNLGYVNANNILTNLYAFKDEELASIQYQQVQLLTPTVATFVTDPSLFVDLTLRRSYREFDWYYLSHFSVYMVLVLSSGYLIFIRKKKPRNNG